MSPTLACVLLALTSSTLGNVGMAAQKRGIGWLVEGLRDRRGRRHFVVWVVGTAMMMAAVFFQAVALYFGPAMIVAGVAGFGLVPMAIFSHAILKDPIRGKERWGLALVLVGVGAVGALASPYASSVPGHFLPMALIWSLAASLVVAGGAIIVLQRTGRVEGLAVVLASLGGALTGFGLIAQRAAALSGEMLRYWSLWFAVSVVAFLLAQAAHQRGRAVQIVPVYTAAVIVFPVILAHLVFGEPLCFTLIAALGLVLAGVVTVCSEEAELP
ncbi:MAG: DMT family transporter [Armatimonadetes bacterium]|nr:DMT family transporter [Armatimonadota bacterium]